MYNRKEILKLLLLIILVLSIPLLFISLEALQRLKIVSAINPNEVITNTLDEFYESISSLPKNNDPSTIRRCLTEIFDLMNEKNYEKLYTLLTDDIKNLMFPTEEIFAEHMNSYLKDNKYSPDFSRYEKLNKEENTVFIVKTVLLPYSTDEIDINATSTSNPTDTFTIYMEDEENYKFSFLAYIGTGKSERTISNDDMSCKIAATHLYTSQTIFDIEITNKLDTDIFLDKNSIYVHTGAMPKYYKTPVVIPANTTKNIQFTIYTGLNLKNSLPTRIDFNGVRVNDKVHLFHIPIKYPVKLSALYI